MAATIVSCVGKALRDDLYREGLELAGFGSVEIEDEIKDLNVYFKDLTGKQGGLCCVSNLEET